MKRIVLTGTYCSKNKGDAAMRISTAEAIKKLLPNTGVTILTPFPEIDSGVYNGSPIVRCSRREVRKTAGVLLRTLLWSINQHALKLDLRRLVNTDEMRSYIEADLIVDLSGDGLTEEYGTKCIVSHLVPILIGLILRKPVFLCAQTIGPFKRTGILARNVLNRVTAISAREQLTYNNLHQSRIIKPKLYLTGDMAFSLRSCPADHAEEILTSEGIDTSRPIIGISVTRLLGHVFELGLKRFEPGEFESIMARVADQIIEQLHADVVFISHTTGPGLDRDDREVARQILRLCSHKQSVHMIEGDYSPSEIKGMIGKTDLFVGLRMHSCIAALSMNVPTICIAYGPKAKGIMSLVGQEEHLLDLPDLSIESLFTMIQHAWADREAIKNNLAASAAQIQELSTRNIFIMAELLKSIEMNEIQGESNKEIEAVYLDDVPAGN